MSAGVKVAFVPYVKGWPIGVYSTIYKAADAMGCSIKSAWYYTTPFAHEMADKRKNGGMLIMKVKLDERDNDDDKQAQAMRTLRWKTAPRTKQGRFD